MIMTQACAEDELLPADQGRAVLPSGARLPARGRVPQEAIRDVLRHWCAAVCVTRVQWVLTLDV